MSLMSTFFWLCNVCRRELENCHIQCDIWLRFPVSNTNTVHWIHTQTHAQPHTNGKITASRRKKNWRVNKAYEIISLSVKFLGYSLFSCNLVVCSFSDFISSSIWWVYHPVRSLNSACTPFFLAFSIISSCFDLFGLSLWTLWRWNIHIFYANKWKWSIDQI